MKPKPIKPVKMWAILREGEINPNYLFYTKSDAKSCASGKRIQVTVTPTRKAAKRAKRK